MLDRLLEILRDGGSHRVNDMARELGTTAELVEAMIENLTRMGHLKQVVGGCGETCTSCSLTATCTAEASGRVWTLTEE
jgi:Mn-dependent DtxR family transcriptional regulator